MRRFVVSLGAAAIVLFVIGFAAPPVASAQQSLNLSIGGFVPRGLDGRPNNDVLVNDLDFLIFELKDFDGPAVGADWLIGFGNYLEGGLGVGWYSRTSPAVYRRYQNLDGSEIEQKLKLRVIPLTATIRVLPLGRRVGFQPYLGVGAGVMRYRYSESGQFIDFSDPNRTIFNDTFIGTGTATGPVVLGGARFSLDAVDFGLELRHQAGKGDLPASESFAGSQIDLGGMNYLFTINIRF